MSHRQGTTHHGLWYLSNGYTEGTSQRRQGTTETGTLNPWIAKLEQYPYATGAPPSLIRKADLQNPVIYYNLCTFVIKKNPK